MTGPDELLLTRMIEETFHDPPAAGLGATIHGDLKRFSFPDLLVYLHKTQKTGMLSIVREPIRKIVFISAGIPTAAQSNLKSELLGEFLVSKGAINREAQQLALEIHREKKISFAAAAMEAGAITRKDLFTLARHQFLTILYSLFGLRTGHYRFEETGLPADLHCYQVSFSSMLVFGIRLISDNAVLSDMLGDMNQVPVRTDRFAGHEGIIFTEKELSVIDRIDSARTIREITQTSESELHVVLKTILILMYSGYIELEANSLVEEQKLVDLQASDVATLGFQTFRSQGPDEEKAVAGDDFLVPPQGIPAQFQADLTGHEKVAHPSNRAAPRRDIPADLLQDRVEKEDESRSQRSNWIHTLLWGVDPISSELREDESANVVNDGYKGASPQFDSTDEGSTDDARDAAEAVFKDESSIDASDTSPEKLAVESFETVEQLEPDALLADETPSDSAPLLQMSFARMETGEADLTVKQGETSGNAGEAVSARQKTGGKRLYWVALLSAFALAVYVLTPWGKAAHKDLSGISSKTLHNTDSRYQAKNGQNDAASQKAADNQAVPPGALEHDPASTAQDTEAGITEDRLPRDLPAINGGVPIPAEAEKAIPVPAEVQIPTKVQAFMVRVNGQPTQVPEGAALVVSTTDTLVIEGVIPTDGIGGPLKINFVGFVGNKSGNDADDRGYAIQPKELLNRFALDEQGRIYRIEAKVKEKPVGEFFVRLNSGSP
jgi:hypothetical protein